MKVRGVLALILLIVTSFGGCIGGSEEGEGATEGQLAVPTWEVGDWWLYTFSTPDFSDDTARLVVASTDEEDATANMLAISSLTEARRHAVLNHNPFLGRITHSDLSPFENGEPQQVLKFPLEEGGSWTFTLFSIEWSALVLDHYDSSISIMATSSDGSRLDYIYDSEVGFFSEFIWKDPNGTENLRMRLSDMGEGHSGDVYFVRGGDLFSETYVDPGTDFVFRDTFLVSDHPSDGGWDEMIYFLDAECGSGSTISLTLRDHMSVSALERVWLPGSSEMGTLGTISYPSEEYTLTATFSGGSAYLRLIIAGGITESWSL